MSHGTGMGYSTVAGFWIPDKAPPPPPKEAPAQAALKGATASKLKMHTAVVSKGAKRLSGKPVTTKKHDSADRKPPQVNAFSFSTVVFQIFMTPLWGVAWNPILLS